jgi:hypothetical protein
MSGQTASLVEHLHRLSTGAPKAHPVHFSILHGVATALPKTIVLVGEGHSTFYRKNSDLVRAIANTLPCSAAVDVIVEDSAAQAVDHPDGSGTVTATTAKVCATNHENVKVTLLREFVCLNTNVDVAKSLETTCRRCDKLRLYRADIRSLVNFPVFTMVALVTLLQDLITSDVEVALHKEMLREITEYGSLVYTATLDLEDAAERIKKSPGIRAITSRVTRNAGNPGDAAARFAADLVANQITSTVQGFQTFAKTLNKLSDHLGTPTFAKSKGMPRQAATLVAQAHDELAAAMDVFDSLLDVYVVALLHRPTANPTALVVAGNYHTKSIYKMLTSADTAGTVHYTACSHFGTAQKSTLPAGVPLPPPAGCSAAIDVDSDVDSGVDSGMAIDVDSD